MRQTPPARGTASPVSARPQPPASVTTAVRLMYAGAAVTALSLVASLLTASAFRNAVHQAHPTFTTTQLNAVAGAEIAFDAVSAVIYIGAWLGMAFASRRGHAWARIMGSALFALYTLLTVLFLRASGTAALVFAGVMWLIGLGAVVFLWRRDASEFFTAGTTR